MNKPIKTKSTFGSIEINHISPPVSSTTPKALNIHVSFEDALKLHLGLNQALMKLNSYNRSTKAGRDSCINLCLFTDVNSMTINEGQVGPQRQAASEPKFGSSDIEALFAEYVKAVEATPMELISKDTYLQHAKRFVRWTKGESVLGSRSRAKERGH